jgi:cysteine desulfuration protein SufE
MRLAQRQTQIALDLLRIEDPQERLSYLVDRAKKRAGLPPVERTADRLIQGCVTKVWLKCEGEPGRVCSFEIDSESLMVRGLASLVAELYSGASPGEIVAFDSTLFEEARLDRMITPTRLHGLAQLQRSIQRFAAELGG